VTVIGCISMVVLFVDVVDHHQAGSLRALPATRLAAPGQWFYTCAFNRCASARWSPSSPR